MTVDGRRSTVSEQGLAPLVPRTRVENPCHSSRTARWRRCVLHAVPELSEVPAHLGRATLCAQSGDGRATFLIRNALVQNLPDQTTETMGDGANRLCVPEPRHQPSIDKLEDTAFRFHRGVGGLIQHSAHVPVALRRAMTVAHARALV